MVFIGMFVMVDLSRLDEWIEANRCMIGCTRGWMDRVTLPALFEVEIRLF